MKTAFVLTALLSFNIEAQEPPATATRQIAYVIRNECDCKTVVIMFPRGSGGNDHKVRRELFGRDSIVKGTIFYPTPGIDVFAINSNGGAWQNIKIMYNPRIELLDLTIWHVPNNKVAAITWNNPPD